MFGRNKLRKGMVLECDEDIWLCRDWSTDNECARGSGARVWMIANVSKFFFSPFYCFFYATI